MEIKRKISMSQKTDRRFIIRSTKNLEQIECAECDSKMLPVEKVAALFEIKQREIFQFIEKGLVHFVETQNSSVMVCLSSVSIVLTQEQLSLKAKE